MTDRTEARITVDLWSDEDFRALTPLAQRLYLFVLSQRALRHCGLLPITRRRWATAGPGMTEDDIVRDLGELEAARFVVIDWDTEELLVRTLLRNDGLFKNARMLPAVVRSVAAIESPKLRAALLAEVRRLPADQVKAEHRDRCVRSWRDLERALGGDASPVEGRVTPTLPVEGNTHVRGDADPHTHPGEDPGPDPHDDGGSRACAIARPPPPSPLPPSPSAGAAQARPTRRTPVPDPFEITDAMRAWAREKAPAITDLNSETGIFLDWHRGRGSVQKDWTATWQTWMRKGQRAAQESRRRPGSRGGVGTFDPAAQDYGNVRI